MKPIYNTNRQLSFTQPIYNTGTLKHHQISKTKKKSQPKAETLKEFNVFVISNIERYL